MAYISATEVKAIRDQLKAKFPKFKWGVRKGSASTSVNVNIKSGPTDFHTAGADDEIRAEARAIPERFLSRAGLQRTHFQVNQYHLGNYGSHAKFFEKVMNIIKTAPSTVPNGRAWFDESDAQIDYFHTAYYIHLSVGDWNNGYTVSGC